MIRRSFLRFLALSPLVALAAPQSARGQIVARAAGPVGAPLATTWGAGVPSHLSAWNKPLSPAARAEFQRTFIDRVLRENVELLESRGFTVDEICKFMGVPT